MHARILLKVCRALIYIYITNTEKNIKLIKSKNLSVYYETICINTYLHMYNNPPRPNVYSYNLKPRMPMYVYTAAEIVKLVSFSMKWNLLRQFLCFIDQMWQSQKLGAIPLYIKCYNILQKNIILIIINLHHLY